MIDLKKKSHVLSPHPEDGEIGCGGLVQKLKKIILKYGMYVSQMLLYQQNHHLNQMLR